MFGLKIFVQIQTFRRVPPVLPRNFCHPASYNDDNQHCHLNSQSWLWTPVDGIIHEDRARFCLDHLDSLKTQFGACWSSVALFMMTQLWTFSVNGGESTPFHCPYQHLGVFPQKPWKRPSGRLSLPCPTPSNPTPIHYSSENINWYLSFYTTLSDTVKPTLFRLRFSFLAWRSI